MKQLVGCSLMLLCSLSAMADTFEISFPEDAMRETSNFEAKDLEITIKPGNFLEWYVNSETRPRSKQLICKEQKISFHYDGGMHSFSYTSFAVPTYSTLRLPTDSNFQLETFSDHTRAFFAHLPVTENSTVTLSVSSDFEDRCNDTQATTTQAAL